MKADKYLGKTIKIIIDRKMGTVHPMHKNIIYEVNYGYVPNTVSGDGEELDCYLLGVVKPVKSFLGVCIAVVHRLNEDDDKLIVVPKGLSLDDNEIEKYIAFQEKYFKHILIRNN